MRRNLKQLLSISLPITILIAIFGLIYDWFSSEVGGVLLALILIQGVLWKFVKWNF